ncbi:MAG: 30S ribosomal protein S9 [Gammaproteobacteria bacterium]
MNAAATCYGTGRRKSSVARVFLKKGTGRVTVNYKDVSAYFTRGTDIQTALSPLAAVDMLEGFDVLITVKGGGCTGQAGAIRHGLARALVVFDKAVEGSAAEEVDGVMNEGVMGFKRILRTAGMLTRDSRKVERKKVGKPKARRSKQFSKR